MAQVVLKIKIDLPGLRKELAEVIKEITTRLEPLGVLEFKGETSDLLKGLEDVTDEVDETGKAAKRTRKTFAEWGMILTGFQSALQSIKQVWSVLSKPLDVAGEFEAYNTQFEVLLGGIDQAKERIAELTDFAATTPFEMPGIVKASLNLENLTKGALSTGPGLTMVGDVAAGVNQPIEELATWFGRLYDGIQNNRPVGEALMRLQELGILSGDARGEIEGLQKTNADSVEVWEVVTEAMSKFDGMMIKQSQNYLGLTSTLSDNTNLLVADIGNKLLPTAKEATTAMIESISYIRENLDTILSTVSTVTSVMAPAIAMLVTYKATIIATTIATNASTIAAKASAIATNIKTVATVTMMAVQKLFTGAVVGTTTAQYGLNTAMNLNPIGLVITLVAGLVVILGELTDWFGFAADEADENTEANKNNAASANLAADAQARLLKTIAGYKPILEELTDEELRKRVLQLNNIIANPSSSEKAITNAKAWLSATKSVLQENMDLANLSLKAKAEGEAKELEQLDNQIKELRNKWVGNAEAQLKIDEIARTERQKIINKYNAREKRKIEKHQRDLQKIQIELMEDGQAKEIAKLKNSLNRKIATHKTDAKLNELLTEKFEQNVAKIKDKYRKKEEKEIAKQNNKVIKHAVKTQNLKIALMENGQEKEIAKLNLKYQQQYLKEINNFARLIELNEEYELEKEAITKKYTDAQIEKTKAAIQNQRQQYQQFFQSFGNIFTNALLHEQQYSNAQVEMQKDRHQKELQSLKDNLAKGEITQKEYDLKRRIATEDQALYLKNVEKDRQTFTQNIADATYKKLISMGAEYLITYVSKKAAEVLVDQSAETAKTVAAQQGTLTRMALAAAEMAKKLALAAASILQAIAQGVATLFASLGPFALVAIPAMVGGVYALWRGVKNTLGFKKGGYTGSGDPNEIAGVAHKDEHIFESALVSKEPEKYVMLHKMLRSGVTLTEIFSALAKHVAPPIVFPQQALAGVSLISPHRSASPSQQYGIFEEMKSVLLSMDNRLKNLESKPDLEEIPIVGEVKLKGKDIYISFKKEEKVRKNRGIDVSNQ